MTAYTTNVVKGNSIELVNVANWSHTLSHVDFETWAKNPDREPVMLVDMESWDETDGYEKHYFSTRSAKSFGYYNACIHRTPVIRRTMGSVFGGHTDIGVGAIDLSNDDGEFDQYPFKVWENKRIIIRVGDISWDISEFRVIYVGAVDRVEAFSDSIMRVHIANKMKILDQPILREETWDLNPEAGYNYIPMCFGRVFNIKPLLTGTTSHEYIIHNDQVYDCATKLFVDGVVNTTLTVNGGGGRGSGDFYISADPNGTFTVNADGGETSYGYLAPIVQIIKTILTDVCSSLTEPDVFQGVMWNANELCYDYTGGIYVTDERTILDVLDELARSALLWYGYDRDGYLRAGHIYDPSVLLNYWNKPVVASIDSNDIVGQIKIAKSGKVIWDLKIGRARNWTPSVGVGTSVESQEKTNHENVYDWYAPSTTEAYRDPETYDRKEKLAKYPDAEKLAYKTLLDDDDTSAQALYDDIMTSFGVQRYKITFDTLGAGYLLNIGDLARISDSRYGLNNQLFMVTDIEEDFVNNKIRIGGWF